MQHTIHWQYRGFGGTSANPWGLRYTADIGTGGLEVLKIKDAYHWHFIDKYKRQVSSTTLYPAGFKSPQDAQASAERWANCRRA